MRLTLGTDYALRAQIYVGARAGEPSTIAGIADHGGVAPTEEEERIMLEESEGKRVVSGASRNLKTIAQTSDVRIVEYTLNPGDSHPWHRHSNVTDRIYCLEGLIGVDTREPDRRFRLHPGETCEVPVGTVHHVSNAGAGTGRYLLVQAMGIYDYIRAD